MAQKVKSFDVFLVNKQGTFDTLLNRFQTQKKDFDFKSLSELRRILSNEKLRIIHTIKEKTPSSVYELAKILGRDIRAVNSDIKLLERFELVDFKREKSGKRIRHKPYLTTSSINISIKF